MKTSKAEVASAEYLIEYMRKIATTGHAEIG
jgi:hypothetical protein